MSIGIYNNFSPAYPVQNSRVSIQAKKKLAKKKYSTGEKISMGIVVAGILTVVGTLIYSAIAKKSNPKITDRLCTSGEDMVDVGLIVDAFV